MELTNSATAIAPTPTPDAAVTQPVSAKRPREPFFDNARLLAIMLVVIGHSWAPLRLGSHSLNAAYAVVYSFHMPVFIMISGYLSRTFTGKPRQLRRLLTGVLAPYVIMQVLTRLFEHWVLGDPLSISMLAPTFALWFLLALFAWRLSAPLWTMLRWPVLLAAAVSLVAGIDTLPMTLAANRTLGFLPFFVLGLSLKPEHFQFLARRGIRIAAVPTLLIALFGAYRLVPRERMSWVFWDESYHQLGTTISTGIVGRAIMLVICTVTAASFLALVPRRRTWFTALGAGSLYVYLLHRFVVEWLKHTDLFTFNWIQRPSGFLVVTVGAATLAVVLATPPVRKVFRPLIEPKLNWLFRA